MIGVRRSFSATIRWRSQIDPSWEVDTRHSGFATAEDAAMAANGLGAGGFETLLLAHGRFTTVDVKGRHWPVEGEVAIWTMAPLAVDLPEEFCFERSDETPQQLSAIGLDGSFAARRFRVLDDESGIDVNVRLVIGQARVVVLAPVARRLSGGELEVPTA